MSTPESQPTAHRILVVDDNAAIHDDFRKIFTHDTTPVPVDALASALFGDDPPYAPDDRYHMDSALQGEEAYAKVCQAIADTQPYTLAFVDIRMPPGWNGIQTISKLREADPDLQFIICTAYSDYSWPEIRRQLGPSDSVVILKKPFDTIEVLQLAHALSQKWSLARAIARHIADLDGIVALRTRELHETNEALRREIAERKHAESALQHSQKMDAIGQLAAGIAHDFNNLLTVVQGHASLSLSNPHLDPDTSLSLQEITRAGERAASLTGQLLAFGRKQYLQPKPFDLTATLRQLHALFGRVLGENIALRIHCDDALPPLIADESQIEQVLINLALNARDAMPGGGTLTIAAAPAHLALDALASHPGAQPGDYILLTLTDTGTGMSADTLSHLFEPFFTTKAKGKGTGLGLATAYGIIKQHRGWIEAASTPGTGSTFRIGLPLGDPADAFPIPPAPTPRESLRGTETLLIVEDEPPVRALLRGVLTQYGYRVLEAENGDAALALWEKHGQEIQLLLTDIIMPGHLSGTALASLLRKESPALRIILSTGYTNQAITEEHLATFRMELLRKPYKAEQLLRLVRTSLDSVAG